MAELPPVDPGRADAEAYVQRHLAHLVAGEMSGSPAFAGGQSRADAALEAFDVAGYAARRNEVLPQERRGASGLSPYIRHGLLTLRQVWDQVAGGPPKDVAKFRDELLWQEYARHWYARLGTATRWGTRRELIAATNRPTLDRTMACIAQTVDELETDGWLVNQTRMWLASHWAVREGAAWRSGEDWFFGHLLDGSRAANRLGWQWTTGTGSAKPYGFSRWQVEKRAPGLCAACPHRKECPIEDWPDDPVYIDAPEVAGPASTQLTGPAIVEATAVPDAVWLTAESLGTSDPAASANAGRLAVFVFDEPLLGRLRLSAKRLVFLVETLAEIATRRPLEIRLGDPVTELAGRPLAVTHAPVPGFAERCRTLQPVEIHPWPWLAPPHAGSVSSFSAWRRRTHVEG